MARVLFTVWPLTGHLHPNFAVADALRERGHEIAFYTGSRARATVEQNRFGFFPLTSVDEREVEELVLSPRGLLSVIDHPAQQRILWEQWVLHTVPGQVDDLLKVSDEWRPDVIVCDPTMWAPFLILHELMGIPVALFSLVPVCFVSGERSPVLGFPMPPARNLAQQSREKIFRLISAIGRMPVRAKANRLRARYGLPKLDCSVTDYAARMPLYLVPGTREFDFNRQDLPSSVHYVGPCLWPGPAEENLPEWVERLPANQPVIYASEGTVHFQPQVLRAVATALADLPVQAILTTGNHRDPAAVDLGVNPVPANIHVAQWIPLRPLLPRLRGIVTIGGPSTLMAALNAGVPAVIVPFYWDHPETAFRLAASGAGIHIDRRSCNAGTMRAAVLAILNNPAYHEAACRLASSFDTPGAPARAADLIAGLTLRTAAK